MKYSFGRSDFSGGAKVAQEGKKNRSKRVFVNDSRSLFLFGRYIYIYFFFFLV